MIARALLGNAFSLSRRWRRTHRQGYPPVLSCRESVIGWSGKTAREAGAIPRKSGTRCTSRRTPFASLPLGQHEAQFLLSFLDKDFFGPAHVLRGWLDSREKRQLTGGVARISSKMSGNGCGQLLTRHCKRLADSLESLPLTNLPCPHVDTGQHSLTFSKQPRGKKQL